MKAIPQNGVFAISTKMRNSLHRTKMRYRSSFFIHLVILFITFAFIFDQFFIDNQSFRTSVTIELLDYNEDGLRPGWPFKIKKHYDVSDLRPYTSKPRILAKYDLPGEQGTPVVLSPVLQDLAELAFMEYQINIVASDKVSDNRSLPDFRDPKCWNIKYPQLLPSTSVVMVVHNEAWSVLMRAIWSVLNRTPEDLLEEIILVDDFSDKEHLKQHLDDYLYNQLPSKMRLIRTKKREGLIRARVIGAEYAKGQVLAFLDGNTESNDGWLEPLLSRIASDRSVVAIPHVDNINFTNIAYEPFDEGFMYGVGWNLYYKPYPIPEREIKRNRGDLSAPYRTPALIGCAIIVDREFFFEIGSFDTGMSIWGGENTELSLRTWMCGGALEIVPCSRMGHYFRILPYSFGGEKQTVKIRNNIRTALVWLDEYKPYFDIVTDHPGDLSKRIALRKELGCKNFNWYLKNVFPESIMIVGYKASGQIQLVNTKYCLDKLGREANRQIGIYTCHGHGYSQGFVYQRNGQIVFHYNLCLSIAEKENSLESDNYLEELNDPNIINPDTNTTNHAVLLHCGPTNGTKWHYDDKNHQIKHIQSGQCLSIDGWMAIVSPCDFDDERQK